MFSLVLTDFVFALAFLLCTSFICCSIVKFQSALFARACLLYHFSFTLSRGFSKLFQKFFQDFFKTVSKFFSEKPCLLLQFKSRYLAAALRGNSFILPHLPPFVNTFFEVFLIYVFCQTMLKSGDLICFLYTITLKQQSMSFIFRNFANRMYRLGYFRARHVLLNAIFVLKHCLVSCIIECRKKSRR